MQSEFGPHRTLQIFFRHGKKIALVFFAAIGVTWAIIAAWPRKFESEAKLIIRVGRESVALDPTVTTSQTLVLQKYQEEEINSALDLLSSRSLAEQVVDRLAARPVATERKRGLIEKASAQLSRGLGWVLLKARVRDRISDREQAVIELRRALSVFAPKKSTVITIQATAKTPQRAQAIGQCLTDAFLAEHLRISSTKGSRAFFDDQVAELEKQLQAKTASLADFRKDHQIVSVDVNRELLKEQLSRVESELSSSRGRLRQVRAEIADLQTKLLEADAEVVASKASTADPTWSGMRQRLYELELQEKELDSKLGNNHPLLAGVRSELTVARKSIADRASERINQTVVVNPVVQAIRQQLQKTETAATGLTSSIDELDRQRQDLHARLDALVEQESRLEQLQREANVLETNYLSHREKLEEARVLDDLLDQRISSVNIVQPATFVERPVSPKKRVLAAVGLFVGLAGGLCSALLAEARDRTLRTSEQAELNLDLPVYAAIPRTRTTSNGTASEDVLAQHCRSLLRQLLAATDGGGSGARTVGVLSCGPGNGGSTVACKLAVTSARDFGLSTLLVDTDCQDRFVTTAFNLNGAPGLRELVKHEAKSNDCIQRDGGSNLALLPSISREVSGSIELNPREVGSCLQSLKQEYELVVIDLPPATAPNDGSSIASTLDHVFLVVESEKTDVASAKRIHAQLKRAGANVSGIVLNKTRDYVPAWLKRLV